jgi:cyclopropane fatty-acyl-phospholipid synthase-like methyltransferase
MARLASLADFEQGGLYTSYRRYPFFAERREMVMGRFGNPQSAGKILIAGCGWGYLVEELLTQGYDVWGCDASAYAVGKAQEVLTAPAAARVILADCLVRSQMTALRGTAGLTGNQRFSTVITEDMLPVLTNAEVTTVLTELRRIAQLNLFHIITCSDVPAEREPTLNWKTQAEWQAIVAPDWSMNTETGIILP